MGKISFREIAKFMDSIRPPYRLRGAENSDYDDSDESLWLHGGSISKRLARNFGLFHRDNKGLFQMYNGNPSSFREVGERHNGGTGTQHKLLVYNTYLVVVAEEKNARAMDIGRMIGRENYDIVCLCEVFDRDQGKKIRNRVDNYGSTRWAEAFGPDSSFWNTSGGLYGLVKEKNRRLVSSKNKKFKDGGEGADEWSNKGWMLMEIDLGPGRIDLFVTHTDAGKEDVSSRKKQIKELIKAIQKRQREYPKNITMAVGDFNVYSSDPEYVWLLKRMWEDCGLRDAWLSNGGKASATHAFSTRCTLQGPPHCACDDYNPEDYGGNRLDYVFIQDSIKDHIMYLDVNRIMRRPFPREKPCGDLAPGTLDNPLGGPIEGENDGTIIGEIEDVINGPVNNAREMFDKHQFMSDHIGLHLDVVSSPKKK